MSRITRPAARLTITTAAIAIVAAGAFLSAALQGTVACAAPTETPAAAISAIPHELSAVEFVRNVNSFSSRLGDDVLIPASIAFFRDAESYRKAVSITARVLRRVWAMEILSVSRKGLRYILSPAAPVADGLPAALVVYWVNGVFRLDLAASYNYVPPAPPDPDPRNYFPSLVEATTGVAGEGSLTAVFNFGPGAEISCTLLPDEAPLTVSTFVALARGLRFIRTVEKVEGVPEPKVDWIKRPWYDGLKGAPGEGRRVLLFSSAKSPGFDIPDEISTVRRHDSPALLTTVPDSPDRWSGAVAITLAPVESLDDASTIFGVCDQKAVDRLSRAWKLRKGVPSVPRLQNVRIIIQ